MAFALVHPRELTRSQLRRALPLTTIAKMMATGALMGVLPRYDHQGEESGPADPLSAAQRIDLADKLLRKGLPDLKTDELIDAANVDASSLPTDPEQLRRFTTDQIRAAIEADYTRAPDAEPVAPEVTPDPIPPIPARPVPDLTLADVSGTTFRGTEPPRKKRARQVPPPQSG